MWKCIEAMKWTTGLALLALCLVVKTTAQDFRAGVAAVDITPPLGIPIAGYYHARGADGVLDPLLSKALVVESGGDHVAFVVLDLISVPRAVTDQARAAIERETGIRGAHVMISATHTHTGPVLDTRAQRDRAIGHQEKLSLDYTTALPSKIVECVRLAYGALGAARLRVAQGRCEALAFNRRFFMRDGTVGWNPGKLNPNITMPAGPVDDEVAILQVDWPAGPGPARAIATYVNFAMHPDTTGGTKLSADWPGALGRVLAQYFGSNHLTLLANGTCGNINHLDVSWNWPQKGVSEANRIGIVLGAAVLQSLKSLRPVTNGPWRVRSEVVELPLPEVTPAQVEQARRDVESTRDDQGGNFMKLVRAHRVLDIASRSGDPCRVEVQVIALGRDLAWVALPGEVFVELGLAIKKRSPFPCTFVVELANENIGYIPDRRSYAEGNYEPESARCAAGSGERLVDAAVRVLEALRL